MDVSKIPPGRNPSDEINAIIEIPQGGVPVKYELDKVSGALFVNRFLHTAPAPRPASERYLLR
jgi:inorganic pyrophosphatase